jgi:large conductance mechanosensitive channel
MVKEFRDFIAKGNVMDLAVGIIIGAAFTAIVNSLVQDLINPVLGLVLGGIDFTAMYWVMSGEVPEGVGLAAAREAGAAVFAYGAFLTAVIEFLIVAWVVFLLVKAVNRVRAVADRPDDVEPEVQTGPSQLDVLIDIRDQLRGGAAGASRQGD